MVDWLVACLLCCIVLWRCLHCCVVSRCVALSHIHVYIKHIYMCTCYDVSLGGVCVCVCVVAC